MHIVRDFEEPPKVVKHPREIDPSLRKTIKKATNQLAKLIEEDYQGTPTRPISRTALYLQIQKEANKIAELAVEAVFTGNFKEVAQRSERLTAKLCRYNIDKKFIYTPHSIVA